MMVCCQFINYFLVDSRLVDYYIKIMSINECHAHYAAQLSCRTADKLDWQAYELDWQVYELDWQVYEFDW